VAIDRARLGARLQLAPDRLLAAGLTRRPAEALLVAEIA
jgi:hypothetical protein